MRTLTLFTIWLFASPAFAAHPCVRGFEPRAEKRAVGVETIHKAGSQVITILLPMPAPGTLVLDLNAMTVRSSYPERFAMSDGTINAAFITVDTSPRSRLSHCVEELAREVQKEAGGKEAQLSLLKDFLSSYLREVPEDYSFPWDPARERRLPKEFAEAANLSAGHFPLATSLTHPAVPLESFLKAGKGACLQKVMLTSLVMKELGLEHRVRAGGTGDAGHMWIELPDGRHLDPTWGLLMKPSRAGAGPGWFLMDRTYLFENQFFPVAVD